MFRGDAGAASRSYAQRHLTTWSPCDTLRGGEMNLDLHQGAPKGECMSLRARTPLLGRSKPFFAEETRGKDTDRFVLKFRKR